MPAGYARVFVQSHEKKKERRRIQKSADEPYRQDVEGKTQKLSNSHLQEVQDKARLIYDLSLKKEGNSDTSHDTDGPWGQEAE